MVWWQYFLFPFSILYDLLTRFRNYLYDRKIIKSFAFDTNVIAVGNLSVGGTGKTPMTAYLIHHFSTTGTNVATLSRGYGRSTSGFRMAGENDNASTLGDEPFMYHLKFPAIGVAVGEERDLAIAELLFHRPETELILLDDAYQHRVVSPSLNILMSDYQRPFYDDFLLPGGRLREQRKNASRADIIIISKCPTFLTEADQVKIQDRVKSYSRAPVFFTAIEYGEPLPIFQAGSSLQNRIVGISGIAGYKGFNDYLTRTFHVKLIHNYGDHHRYSRMDIKDIINELDEGTSLITTEKDRVKLCEFSQLMDFSCFYIPIEVKFLKNEALFLSMVESVVKKDGGKEV